jgi:hypothetical protein
MTHRFAIVCAVLAIAAGCADEDHTASSSPDAALGDARSDAAPSQLATVAGSIRRSAQPMGDARGNIYVALFDEDPVTNMDTAKVVARALLEAADLSAQGASVAYTLTDVPTRSADYFLVAFLDDNGNVDPATPDAAGPDKGDLVSLDGLAAPKLQVASVGTTQHDIVLNSVLPF